jgi:hypothetical protein
MLKPQDIEFQVGKGAGGDFIVVIHKPTGIRRVASPPLPTPGVAKHDMVREIQAELLSKGLTQHILPPKSMNEAEWNIRQALPEVGVLIERAFADVGGSPEAGSALDQVGLQNGVSVVEENLNYGEQGLALAFDLLDL